MGRNGISLLCAVINDRLGNCYRSLNDRDLTGRGGGGNRGLGWGGVSLAERDRWLGRPRFVCVSRGGVSKRGKGGSGPTSPSSLPLFYIEVGEAYAPGGDGGRTALPPPPPFRLLQSI